MRKRIWIIALGAMTVTAVTASWGTADSKRRIQKRILKDVVLSKSGDTAEGGEMRNAQLAVQGRELLRQELSGSTLFTDAAYLPKGIDGAAATELAQNFRRLAPVPPDRVDHFRWIERADDVAAFVGWGAAIDSAKLRGNDLLVELRVWPHLESEFAIGGGLTPDHYFETYVVRAGHLEYVGGRSPELVRRQLRPSMDHDVVRSYE